MAFDQAKSDKEFWVTTLLGMLIPLGVAGGIVKIGGFGPNTRDWLAGIACGGYFIIAMIVHSNKEVAEKLRDKNNPGEPKPE